jgi:hypothetical protein
MTDIRRMEHLVSIAALASARMAMCMCCMCTTVRDGIVIG